MAARLVALRRLVWLCASLGAVLAAFAPAAARADACPNASERFGASANLPDCRAYELVTPMIKEDNNYLSSIRSFADGDHVFIQSLLPYPGAQNGQVTNALATRTASGWVTTAVTPPQRSGEPDYIGSEDVSNPSLVVSFTADFSAGFVNSTFASDPLDQDSGEDVYKVDIPSGVSSLASLPDSGPMTDALIDPPGVQTVTEVGSYIAGNSADGSRVFFETTARLPTAPGTPADTHTSSNELYERHGGHTYLVGVLPNGSAPSCGAEVANGGLNGITGTPNDDNGIISPDGSNVVFRSPGEDSQCGGVFPTLYLRVGDGTPAETTVELPGEKLVARSADGMKLFTEGATGFSFKNIYEYDVATGQTTVIAEGYAEPLAISPDGSRVYYMTIEPPEKGEQIYLFEHGKSTAIMDASAAAGFAGHSALPTMIGGMESVPSTSSDGSKLLFLDRATLTDYDNADPACAVANSREGFGQGGNPTLFNHCIEAYLYNAEDGSVTCVSCNPNLTPPVGNAYLYQNREGLQAATVSSPFLPATVQALSDDGSRAFFETEEALVPQDTNGTWDVYEREGGHLYMLSSGAGSRGSYFVGTSGDGNDVFIQTTDHLLPQDLENSQEVYDARVDGGFPYTPAGHGCDSGQCQGPQTPAPVFSAPPSATFVGIGNPAGEAAHPAPARKATKSKRPAKKTSGRKRRKHGNRKRGGKK